MKVAERDTKCRARLAFILCFILKSEKHPRSERSERSERRLNRIKASQRIKAFILLIVSRVSGANEQMFWPRFARPIKSERFILKSFARAKHLLARYARSRTSAFYFKAFIQSFILCFSLTSFAGLVPFGNSAKRENDWPNAVRPQAKED